jgi:hypothetical protein
MPGVEVQRLGATALATCRHTVLPSTAAIPAGIHLAKSRQKLINTMKSSISRPFLPQKSIISIILVNIAKNLTN